MCAWSVCVCLCVHVRGVCMCAWSVCVCVECVCGCIVVCMCVVHACSIAPRLHMENSAEKDILVLQTAAPCIPSLRGSSFQKAVRDDVCGNVCINVYS